MWDIPAFSRTRVFVPAAVLSLTAASSAVVAGPTGVAAAPTFRVDEPVQVVTPVRERQVARALGHRPATVTTPQVVLVSYRVPASGIPTPALRAYKSAAAQLGASDPACHLPWQLLAAIGRVESDHGQAQGNQFTAQGVVVPGIYGPELNGRDGVAAIGAFDGGAVDGDPNFQRAVGPMQFLPSTWAIVGADGDGDGRKNPQDINDAALAAGIYLCAGQRNLATDAGRHAAVFSYNHSASYVATVIALMQAYASGNYFAQPAAVAPASAAAASKASSIPHKGATPTRHVAKPTASKPKPKPKPVVPASPSPTPTPSPQPTASPTTGGLLGILGL